MLDFLSRLQTIDRRWIYLAVAIACTIPFIKEQPTDVFVTPETQAFYDAVESVKAENDQIRAENIELARLNKEPRREKVVLCDSPWGPGCIGEIRGQTEALFEHLLRNRTPFIIVSLDGDPLAPSYNDDIMKKLLKKPQYADRKYGVDYVNVGITKTDWQAMIQMATDFRKQCSVDSRGTSTSDFKALPIMEKIRNISDVALVTCCNYWPNENWIAFVHEQFNTRVAFGGGGISSTTMYRYLPSGQLAGFLVGTRGGAEYDALLHSNIKDRVNLGSKLIVPLSYGHIVIILAIVLGNIGYFATQRKRGRQ